MKNYIQIVITLLFVLVFASGCFTDLSADKEQTKIASENERVPLTISAAASLKGAMDRIKNTYEEEYTEIELKLNYGGSGSLQQQISQGAPVDVFFSSTEDKFDKLVEEGMIAKEDVAHLLGNELVLIAAKDEPSIRGFEDLVRENVEKISIGIPQSVPAGKYAQESLEKIGVWKEVESKMVYAKDVRQVLSYVETGNVSAGIVYKTDALISNEVNIVATANPQMHTPIVYPVGIIKDSKQYEAAKDFYNYLKSDAALKVFEEYGFTIK